MPAKPSQPVAPREVWRAGGLRLTVLRTPTSEATPTDWWAKIVGVEPESRTSKPKAGELLEQGSFAEGSLVLATRPERIDWQYVATRKEDAIIGFPDVGPLRVAADAFVPPMMKWLEVCPPASRLAFGASLFLSVGGREEGYAKLAEYLHSVKMDPKGSSDFTYQINRSRNSKVVEGLSVNRLSRWDVASSGRVQIQVTPTAQMKMTAQSLPGMEFAIHAELDINTAAEFAGDLPPGNLRAILDELVGFAIEISEQGDVA
jgi:hypothetical protein